MNRNDAERALRDTTLPMAETLVMLWLLSRANWADCTVPDQFTPAMTELAAWTRMDRQRLRRTLGHLERHGWISRTPGRGRGRKSVYLLMSSPRPCTCIKGGRTAPLLRLEKGVSQHQEKGVKTPAEPQVNPPIALRAAREEVREGPDLCEVCDLVMDPVLPACGYRTHPCCDPAEVSPSWSRLVAL